MRAFGGHVDKSGARAPFDLWLRAFWHESAGGRASERAGDCMFVCDGRRATGDGNVSAHRRRCCSKASARAPRSKYACARGAHVELQRRGRRRRRRRCRRRRRRRVRPEALAAKFCAVAIRSPPRSVASSRAKTFNTRASCRRRRLRPVDKPEFPVSKQQKTRPPPSARHKNRCKNCGCRRC